MNTPKSPQEHRGKPVPPPPTYRSDALFKGGKVVVIVHEGREYSLRITQAGKLILTA